MCVRRLLFSLGLMLWLTACGSDSLDQLQQKATDIGNPNIKTTKLIIENNTNNRNLSGEFYLNKNTSLSCHTTYEGNIGGFEIVHDLVLEHEDNIILFELGNMEEIFWEDFSDFVLENHPLTAYCTAKLINLSSGRAIQHNQSPVQILNIQMSNAELISEKALPRKPIR